jgi:hypothetical protein
MLLFPSPLTGVVMAMVEILVWHSLLSVHGYTGRHHRRESSSHCRCPSAALVLSCATRRQHVLSTEVSDSKTIVADSRPTTRIGREAVSAFMRRLMRSFLFYSVYFYVVMIISYLNTPI